MRFVNLTKNTIDVSDIRQQFPYLEEESQFISTDNVKRSRLFQTLCLTGKFKITEVSEDRIEQGLLRFQQGKIAPEKDKIEVVIKGHFYSNTGLGKANRNLVYALSRQGIKVGIDTKDISYSNLNQIEIERISRYSHRQVSRNIQIYSMIPSFVDEELDSSSYCILNTTIEAASVPKQFINVCEQFNEVWVVSDFCKQILLNYGVSRPIYVIPNAIDTSLYNETAVPYKFSTQLNKFIFISVLSWGFRKGYDVLLNAWLNEFTPKDPVSLLLVTKYGEEYIDDNVSGEIREFIGNKEHAQIVRLGRELQEFEMARLYKACNCFVLSSRGEGFCYPCTESSLCGLPVIATNHSGHTMFLNKDNSYLLDIDRLSIISRGTTNIHYWDEQLFADLSGDCYKKLGKLMRQVFENYDEAKIKNKKLQEKLSIYSYDEVGKLAKSRLEHVNKTINSIC